MISQARNVKAFYTNEKNSLRTKYCRIEFQLIGDKKYAIEAMRIGEEWVVLYSGHANEEESKTSCSLCGKSSKHFEICLPLKEKEKELFQSLIKNPSVRTRWVFEKTC